MFTRVLTLYVKLQHLSKTSTTLSIQAVHFSEKFAKIVRNPTAYLPFLLRFNVCQISPSPSLLKRGTGNCAKIKFCGLLCILNFFIANEECNSVNSLRSDPPDSARVHTSAYFISTRQRRALSYLYKRYIFQKNLQKLLEILPLIYSLTSFSLLPNLP